MSNYGIIKYGLPAERERGLVFAENFENIIEVNKNGGSINGSPTITNGLILDGSQTDYVTSYCNIKEEEALSIVFSFTPDFSPSENVTRYLFDSQPERLYAVKRNTGDLVIGLFNVSKNVSKSEYEDYWKVGEKNNITIVLNSTGDKIYLNGILISDTTRAITISKITTFYIGSRYTYYSTDYTFKGTINYIKIFNKELTAQEVVDYSNGNTFNYEKEWISGQKLLDGDMEESGTSDWTSFVRASGSKDATTFHSGTQSLKITRDDPTFSSSTFYARQDCIKTGRTYKVTGYYKTDGSVDYAFVGTTVSSDIKLSNPTEWTYFEGFIYNSPRDYFILSALMTVNTDGVQVWWDDVTVREYRGGAELILPMGLEQHSPSHIDDTELLTNGDFSAWTGGYPDNYSHHTNSASAFVEEVTDGVRYYTTGDNIYLRQTPLTIGKTYKYRVVITDVTSGSLKLENAIVSYVPTIDQVGVTEGTFVCADNSYISLNRAVACDITVSEFSIKEIKPSTLDVSGNANHATFGDGSTSTTFPTKLSERHGYSFDGGDYLNLGVQDFSGDFSFVTRVSTDDIGTTSFIAGTSTSLSAVAINGWAIYLGTIGTVWTFQVGDGSDTVLVKTTQLVQAKKEYTLGLSWNNTAKTLTAYIDGENIGSDTDTNIGDIDVNANFYIGRVLTSYLTGKISYNVFTKNILSDMQMKDLHLRMLKSINRK